MGIIPIFPLTDVGSIYKQKRTGNTEAYDATPAYTDVNLTISPTGQDIMPSEGGIASYQLFEVFIWDITIEINNGDKIVAGSVNYLVTGSPNLYNNRYVQAWRTLAKVIL